MTASLLADLADGVQHGFQVHAFVVQQLAGLPQAFLHFLKCGGETFIEFTHELGEGLQGRVHLSAGALDGLIQPPGPAGDFINQLPLTVQVAAHHADAHGQSLSQPGQGDAQMKVGRIHKGGGLKFGDFGVRMSIRPGHGRDVRN